MDIDIYEDSLAMAMTAEGAASILKNFLLRPHMRGNGKSMITSILDTALLRALISLEKEIKEEKGNETT